MLASGNKSFYTVKEGATILQHSNKITNKIPGQDDFIILNNIRENME
jgi:3-hydroxyacyl-CoA dehydrogenase